ncbi:25517_t:CDS:2, partial [Gigaspora rosea]
MQFRIIAQALMSDETTDSYEWHAIIIEYPLARHLLCIWHIKENIKKALCEKMNNSFADFYSAFWKFRNAETPDTFNYYWREMVTNYPTALEYLKRQLYKQCKAWARGFTTMLFTLGIESTSFVESQNACIKCVFENSNTSLCELGKHEDIEDEMDSVSICAKFLLQQLDYSSIVEVWNISQVTCQN